MLKALTKPESNPLSEFYSSIEAELGQVESLLASELRNRHAAVNELLSRTNRLSGKRLRPALLLLFAKTFGSVNSDHVKLAAAIEMVHTATLVHDDILDSADQRRHSPTLNYEFGNQAAILTGDYLFSHAFYLTSTLPTTRAAQEIGRATNIVCEGEMRQIGTKSNYGVTEPEYLEIVDAKTAVLCSCAAKLGAHYGGADKEQVQAAADYGTRLGIAFQIVDDLLDLTGDETAMGKSLGTDLQQHKPTLPMIHHLQALDKVAREDFIDKLIGEKHSPDEIIARLNESGSLQYAKKKAKWFADEAIDALNVLPTSRCKDVLATLPGFVLQRSH